MFTIYHGRYNHTVYWCAKYYANWFNIIRLGCKSSGSFIDRHVKAQTPLFRFVVDLQCVLPYNLLHIKSTTNLNRGFFLKFYDWCWRRHLRVKVKVAAVECQVAAVSYLLVTYDTSCCCCCCCWKASAINRHETSQIPLASVPYPVETAWVSGRGRPRSRVQRWLQAMSAGATSPVAARSPSPVQSRWLLLPLDRSTLYVADAVRPPVCAWYRVSLGLDLVGHLDAWKPISLTYDIQPTASQTAGWLEDAVTVTSAVHIHHFML